MYYVHSKCCGAHWELVILDSGKYELRCEKCEKSTGDEVQIIGALIPKCECEKG